VSNDWNLATQR